MAETPDADASFDAAVEGYNDGAATAAPVKSSSILSTQILQPLSQFVADSRSFIVGCEKPAWSEFSKTLAATALGAFIMGMIAFVVKIIHIPVTQMLVSGGGSS